MMQNILLLGASGVMGKHIHALLARLVPEVQVICCSRTISPTHQRETMNLDIFDTNSLRVAIAGFDAVINAIGPFEYDPTPLIEGCLEVECHYLDIAETPDFINTAISIARTSATNTCVLSGCSTVPGLIHVLAQRWQQHEQVKQLRVYLSLGSRKPVSAALLYSLLRPLGKTAPDGISYYSHILGKTFGEIGQRYFGRYPAPFEKQGVPIGQRQIPTNFYVGMDTYGHALALRYLSKYLPVLSDTWLHKTCQLCQPLTYPITWLGKHLGMLSLEALDNRGDVVDEIQIRAPRDGLNIPALPVVWAIRELSQARIQGGAWALEQAFTHEQVISWLRKENYEVILANGVDYDRR